MDGIRVLQVFDECIKRIRVLNVGKKRIISKEMLSVLNNLFGNQFRLGIRFVSSRKVKILRSPTGREVYRVKSKDMMYVCYRNVHYCNCYDFRNTISRRRKNLLCKHIIATRLADAMNVCKTFEVSEEELKQQLISFSGEKIPPKVDPNEIPKDLSSYLKWLRKRKMQEKKKKKRAKKPVDTNEDD